MLSKRLSRLIKICAGTGPGADGEWSQPEGFVEIFVHFWTLVARHFIRNRCLVRASALAFTSLLALIPLLVVAVGVTSSLLKSEGEDQIYQAIDHAVSAFVPPAAVVSTNGQYLAVTVPAAAPAGHALPPAATNAPVSPAAPLPNPADTNAGPTLSTNLSGGDTRVMIAQREAARSIHEYIQNAQSGKLGITGMVLFIFTAFGMLRGVENTFNDIWGVTVERRWWHQLSSYFTLVALGPVVLIAAVSLAAGPSLHWADHLVANIPGLGRVLLQLGPLVFLWLMFALFYLLVPNTQVKFSAALFGGLIAGTLWHVNNLFAFLYLSRVVTNSAIYGKLGLLPVFMAGLYFSWVILLFGAQAAYAFQNRVAYLQDRIAENVNQRGREFVALRIMTLLGQRFRSGLPPAPVIDLSRELGIPSRLTQIVLRTLSEAQLVTETTGKDHAFQPARPLEAINAHQILQAMRAGSGRDLLVDETKSLAGIYGDFARIEAAERAAAEKISVLTLVQHLPAPLSLASPANPEALNQNQPAGETLLATPAVNVNGSAEPWNQTENDPVSAEATVPAARPENVATETAAMPPGRPIAQPKDTEFPL